jgi:hypothetical protein
MAIYIGFNFLNTCHGHIWKQEKPTCLSETEAFEMRARGSSQLKLLQHWCCLELLMLGCAKL